MSNVENPEEDALLNKNNPGGDDQDDIDLGDEGDDGEGFDDSEDGSGDDGEEDDAEGADDSKKKSDARAKLNAQNRFLIKEGYEFVNGKWAKPDPSAKKKQSSSKSDRLSTSDVFTLVKANITEEDDIAEIETFAKFKGITIKEALSNKTMQQILANNAEERATANATHTGSSKRTVGKKAPSEILDGARKGQLPDDPTELARARAEQRQGKRHK